MVKVGGEDLEAYFLSEQIWCAMEDCPYTFKVSSHERHRVPRVSTNYNTVMS